MKDNVMPVRRNLEFHLPKDRIHDWHPRGVHVSHFMNCMSIFFPDGERFFIDSVRHYRDDIKDPELKEQVRGFIGQEAMHGREHEEYNDAMTARGLPADRMGRFVLGLLNVFRRITPKSMQLAATVALEHLTAILANMVLIEPKILAGAEPRYAAIWKWHALEETEHKAVAFDVYQATVGRGLLGYLNRCFALLISTFIFFLVLIPFHMELVRREGQLFNLVGWARLANFQWISPGAFRRTLLDWLDWFRPGFHPWDHDNHEYLVEVDGLVDEVTGYAPAAGKAGA